MRGLGLIRDGTSAQISSGFVRMQNRVSHYHPRISSIATGILARLCLACFPARAGTSCLLRAKPPAPGASATGHAHRVRVRQDWRERVRVRVRVSVAAAQCLVSLQTRSDQNGLHAGHKEQACRRREAPRATRACDYEGADTRMAVARINQDLVLSTMPQRGRLLRPAIQLIRTVDCSYLHAVELDKRAFTRIILFS